MTPRYVDVHSHIHSKEFDADREAVISRMEEKGVLAITVGTDLSSSQKAVALASESEDVFASIGQHPVDNKNEAFEISDYESLVKNPKVVAIGECGLDYFRALDTLDEKKRQREIFERQIEFSLTHHKPLMIHCRNAYDDVLEILASYRRDGEVKGNVHFFAGGKEIARRFLDLNFTFSFTGVITFTQDYDEVIRFLPLSHILSETDCPFVAPIPFRGKRNEPSFISFTIRRIGEIKGISESEAGKALFNNACRAFNLPAKGAAPSEPGLRRENDPMR